MADFSRRLGRRARAATPVLWAADIGARWRRRAGAPPPRDAARTPPGWPSTRCVRPREAPRPGGPPSGKPRDVVAQNDRPAFPPHCFALPLFSRGRSLGSATGPLRAVGRVVPQTSSKVGARSLVEECEVRARRGEIRMNRYDMGVLRHRSLAATLARAPRRSSSEIDSVDLTLSVHQ